MSKIRKPSLLLSSKVILMSICMDFDGRPYHDLAIVHRLARRVGIKPEVVIAAIEGNYPSTANNTVH